jgi:hypothetical protein
MSAPSIRTGLLALGILAIGLRAAAPLLAEDPPPVAPAPKEEPPKPAETPRGPTAEAKEVLLRAIARQGSGGLLGEKAVTRFVVHLDPVLIVSDNGDKVQTRSVEAFAHPDRVRAEWKVDGKVTVLAHSGRTGWTRRGDEDARRIEDPEGKDREDLAEIDLHRRVLRLTRDVFFLPHLLELEVVVQRLPDREMTFPRGNGDVVKARCHMLKVPARDTLPGMVLFIDATTLDPLAVKLDPMAEGQSTWLLTFSATDREKEELKLLPPNLRVPFFLELFEQPPAAGSEVQLRIQAEVKALEIDPTRIPDDFFKPPAVDPSREKDPATDR